MGSAFRLHFEEGTKQSRGKDVLACLYRRASKLDRICRRLEVTPICDFHDGLDAAPDAFHASVTDTLKIMVKSKLWFPIADGRASFVPLLHWLEQNPTRFGLVYDDYRGILDELRRCVAELESRSDESCRFNLGVVSSTPAG